MTKVLWVTNSLGLGGAERQIANMASFLNRDGFEIDVVYYSNTDTRMLEATNYDFNTIFIDKNRLGNLKCLLEIRKLIVKNQYEIAHAFGGGTANIYMRYAAFFTRTKIVIGAMLGKKHFARIDSKILNSFANLRTNYWTVNNTDLIPILFRDLRFTNKNNVFMLNNGFLDREMIEYKAEETTYYDKLKGSHKVFVIVGRLVKVKNIELFIDAALEIIKESETVDFWIIGDGPMYEKLHNIIHKNKAEDRIKMLGYRSDIDIALDRADIFTLTSFTEGSPNAMAEAMRAKKPLISTKCTSLKQFIIENQNGISVDVNNCEQLITAMKILLSKSNSELLMMGEISYSLFKKNFEIEKVATEFKMLYTSLLERGRK